MPQRYGRAPVIARCSSLVALYRRTACLDHPTGSWPIVSPWDRRLALENMPSVLQIIVVVMGRAHPADLPIESASRQARSDLLDEEEAFIPVLVALIPAIEAHCWSLWAELLHRHET
jgi:hypothetical protein